MKTILYVFLCLFIIQSMNLNAQNNNKDKAFLRVYNLDGKKISKGKYVLANDSLIMLKNVDDTVKVKREEIGYIKTKRSAGNNVLIGAASGATVFGILGAASADPDAWILAYSASEGAAMGGVVGGLGGAAIGGITALFKKSQKIVINGDYERWKIFINLIREQ